MADRPAHGTGLLRGPRYHETAGGSSSHRQIRSTCRPRPGSDAGWLGFRGARVRAPARRREEEAMNWFHRRVCRSARWRRRIKQVLPWALQGVELGDEVLEVGPGPGVTPGL